MSNNITQKVHVVTGCLSLSLFPCLFWVSLIPLDSKSGLKTILKLDVIMGDYQNNRQWGKVFANWFICPFSEQWTTGRWECCKLQIKLFKTEYPARRKLWFQSWKENRPLYWSDFIKNYYHSRNNVFLLLFFVLQTHIQY